MDVGGINAAGIATAVWTNATRTTTQGGGLFYGFPTLAVTSATAISLTSVATTSVLTLSSKVGIVLSVGVSLTITMGTGAATAFVDIIADGNTMSIPIFSGVQAWDAGGLAVANFATGAGAVAGNAINFVLGAGFLTSITVQFRITATTLNAGQVTCAAMWAHT